MNHLLDITDEITVMESKDRGYFPHDVFLLQDGTLIAAVNDRAHHTSLDGRICTIRSRDGGQTWTDFRTVVWEERQPCDYRDPSVFQISDGTLFLIYFRWNGHAGGSWAGSHMFVLSSKDLGETWSEPRPLDVGPFDYATCTERCIELPDGALLMPMQAGTESPPSCCSALWRSDDHGQSWRYFGTIQTFEGKRVSNETALCRTVDGVLVAVIRSDDNMHAARSLDDGATWRCWPMPDTPPGTQPSLNVLGDGRLLLCYGDRGSGRWDERCSYNMRIVARLSEDGGRTFAEPISLREYLPHADMGYPTSVELAPGRILTMYWRSEPDPEGCGPRKLHYALVARIWKIPESRCVK